MARGLARSLGMAIAVAAALLAVTSSASASVLAPAVSPSVRVYLPDTFLVLGHPVTVPRRVIRVTGVVKPYVAGQTVKVRVLEGSRLVRVASVRISAVGPGHGGRFSHAFSLPDPGEATVLVGHTRNAAMRAFLVSRRLTVLDERVGFGSTGRFVVLIQQRLAALHFYVPQTGVYDAGTGLAVDAYHRLLHWGTSQTLDGRTISFLLDGLGSFKLRYPQHGRHAEANLSLQLLALSNGSHVEEIFPVSSGKPTTPTILGDFHIYRRVPGYLPDGMYYSDFFHTGYAIHGYNPAPDYPASHGCIRIPIADAIAAYNWLAMGDWVDVYY